MRIGIPKEIKVHEYRAGMTPAGVRELTAAGHEVVIETNLGAGIGYPDEDYAKAGADVASAPSDVFASADLIVKVKEPQLHECDMLKPGQVLFTYLHLAADAPQADALMASGATAIAYETVTDNQGGLPLLTPMSEVAGRMSTQVGANFLQKAEGGRGVLLGGVPGVEPGRVVIIGGGVSGTNAAQMAVGLGADVAILDRSIPRLRALDLEFDGRVRTLYSTAAEIEEQVLQADLVIGAVLIPGAAAPKLVTKEMVKAMRKGAVMVDIAIDQGGCFETSRPTTHQDPTYVIDDVVHYCVTNMPGAVARTSTLGLTNATLPFTLALANKGADKAMADDEHLARGLNVKDGAITHRAVAEALGKEFKPLKLIAA